jgi:hypothetical protein
MWPVTSSLVSFAHYLQEVMFPHPFPVLFMILKASVAEDGSGGRSISYHTSQQATQVKVLYTNPGVLTVVRGSLHTGLWNQTICMLILTLFIFFTHSLMKEVVSGGYMTYDVAIGWIQKHTRESCFLLISWALKRFEKCKPVILV